MRELKPLRLQKTHANRKSTSKSRKRIHQFDSRCCKCSQHKQIKNFIWSAFLYLVVLWPFAARVLSNWQSCFLKLQVFCSQFAVHLFIWLCCEHLQRVCCQIDKVVFLIYRCFFLFSVRWTLSTNIQITINNNRLEKYIKTMLARMQAVIKSKGDHTNVFMLVIMCK